MLISITTEHVYSSTTDIFEQMGKIYRAGFRGIDFTACRYIGQEYKYGDTEFFCDDWKSWIREIRAWGDAHNIRFTQVHNLTHNYFNSGNDTELLNDMIDRVFEACEILGIKVAVMHPAVPPGAGKDIKTCHNENAAFFKQKANIASYYNVSLAIENMVITKRFSKPYIWRYCNKPDQLIRLVDDIDEPNVGFCLDTGHSHYMGENVYETILKYGKRLIALHLHDNNQYYDHHLMPYHGTLDWDLFSKGIAEVNYQGALNFESFNATLHLPSALQELMLKEIFSVGCDLLKRIEKNG